MRMRERRVAVLAVVAVLSVVALGTVVEWRTTSPAPVVNISSAARALAARRETRPTLEPALFRGEAAEAYRIAREMPDVLDQLQCHCACRSEYGHVSLLSCYADGHGST
jgi:hypothetical protein